MNEHITTLAAAVLLSLFCSPCKAVTNTLNIGHYPNGLVVRSGTVMSNQWRTTGLVVSGRRGAQYLAPVALASVAGNPPSYMLFSPDAYGAVATFDFVETNTFEPGFADYFQLTAGMDPNETITLVGLAENGQTVAQTNFSRGASGAFNVPTPLAISGHFKRVECRTFGNPGIGMYGIRFQTVALPRVTISNGGSDANVCWSTVVGWQYQLEYRSALTSNTWMPHGIPVIGNGSAACVLHSHSVEPVLLYRIRMLP